MSRECVVVQNCCNGQILLHVAKAAGRIQTLSLNLSCLHEECTLPGELFISMFGHPTLKYQPP